MKKLLLFASLALGLVVVALPASAMGTAIITEHGKQLSNKTVGFEGFFEFNTLGSGLRCSETTLSVLINGATVTAESFVVTNPTTECTFFGAVYKDCDFKQHPVADNVDLAQLTVTKGVGTEHTIDVTAPSAAQPHPTLTSELKTKVGSTGVCNVTTNDLTVVDKTLTASIETVGGFIHAIKLGGTVKIDQGTAAQGTTKPVAEVAAGVAGTLTFENAGGTTMTVS